MQTVVTSDNNYVVCCLFQACHAYPVTVYVIVFSILTCKELEL